jgi:plastocyanin
MKKALLIIVGLIIIGGLVYLGYFYYWSNYKTPSQPVQSTQSANQNSVNISNFSFNPADLTVKAGTAVTWTNNDSTTHTVTFDSFQSGNIAPGSSYSHTFSDKGTFNYHCSIHPSMTGKVVIQ